MPVNIFLYIAKAKRLHEITCLRNNTYLPDQIIQFKYSTLSSLPGNLETTIAMNAFMFWNIYIKNWFRFVFSLYSKIYWWCEFRILIPGKKKRRNTGRFNSRKKIKGWVKWNVVENKIKYDKICQPSNNWFIDFFSRHIDVFVAFHLLTSNFCAVYTYTPQPLYKHQHWFHSAGNFHSQVCSQIERKRINMVADTC